MATTHVFFFCPPPPQASQRQKARRLPSLEGTPSARGCSTLTLAGMEWTTLLSVLSGRTGGGPSPLFLSPQCFSGRTGIEPSPFKESSPLHIYVNFQQKFPKLKILSIADCCKASIASYMPRAKAFGSNSRGFLLSGSQTA